MHKLLINKPPSWQKYLTKVFERGRASPEMVSFIKRVNADYLYWGKFKYLPMPRGFSKEEAWAYLKFSRLTSSERTLIKTKSGEYFTYSLMSSMYQIISYVDTYASGLISDVERVSKPKMNQLLISGLSEEAIASSQIEGANTSRKVAKKMLMSQRKANNKDEQMIINNYQVMQRLQEWKDLDLSIEMIIEIQKNITRNTLEDSNDVGRIRNDSDNIAVMDKLTGDIIFTPPNKSFVLKELKSLVNFANLKDDKVNFVHPVIKASILHFWLAYLHPFADGNGRTARAIFYWYLLKNNYWLLQYISVSRIIKKSKKQYDDAFLYAEIDENDLTYFLKYQLKSVQLAIKEFISHYQKKLLKDKQIIKLSEQLAGLNSRQISLLQDLNIDKDTQLDITTHKTKYQIAYETARKDLTELYSKEYLSQIRIKNKFYYIPNTLKIKNLFKN